ncbi:MAG: hypothetical protein V7727_21930, partial [Sneathiella sp.]
VCAHIGKVHGRKWARTDPFDLDNPNAVQHVNFPLPVCFLGCSLVWLGTDLVTILKLPSRRKTPRVLIEEVRFHFSITVILKRSQRSVLFYALSTEPSIPSCRIRPKGPLANNTSLSICSILTFGPDCLAVTLVKRVFHISQREWGSKIYHQRPVNNLGARSKIVAKELFCHPLTLRGALPGSNQIDPKGFSARMHQATKHSVIIDTHTIIEAAVVMECLRSSRSASTLSESASKK